MSASWALLGAIYHWVFGCSTEVWGQFGVSELNCFLLLEGSLLPPCQVQAFKGFAKEANGYEDKVMQNLAVVKFAGLMKRGRGPRRTGRGRPMST